VSVWQAIFGALFLGAGEGAYLLLRWLSRRFKRSSSGAETGMD